MAKIQAVWAIDIGQSALKAIKLIPAESPDQAVAEASLAATTSTLRTPRWLHNIPASVESASSTKILNPAPTTGGF